MTYSDDLQMAEVSDFEREKGKRSEKPLDLLYRKCVDMYASCPSIRGERRREMYRACRIYT